MMVSVVVPAEAAPETDHAAGAFPLDGAAFDARSSSSEAEEALLSERLGALTHALAGLRATCGGALAPPRGALAALAGGLAALAGDAALLAPTDAGEGVGAVMPESRLALAVARLGEEDADTPPDLVGIAGPLAAALGAGVLAPLCAGLVGVGARRAALAAALSSSAGAPLAQLQDRLRAVAAARADYARRRREAEHAREAAARLNREKTSPAAREAAAHASAESAFARDAARASLSASIVALEGERRTALVKCFVGIASVLRAHHAACLSDLDALSEPLATAETYATSAAAQAQARGGAHDAAVASYLSGRRAAADASKARASVAHDAPPTPPHAPNEGGSAASRAVREGMRRGGRKPLHHGWLSLRAAGGWHSRYFALLPNGVLLFDRSPEAAAEAAEAEAEGGWGEAAAAAQPAPTAPDDAPSVPPPPHPIDAPDAADAPADGGAASSSSSDEGGGAAPDDAAALAKAVGSAWSLGSSLFRSAAHNVAGALGGAPLHIGASLLSGARDLAAAAGRSVTAPSTGRVALLTASIKLGGPESDAATAQLPSLFRVVTPRSVLTLQAIDADDRAGWVDALRGSIAELLVGGGGNGGASGGGGAATLAAIRAAPGSDSCADCGAPEPDWASLNACVVICQRCAGAHRRLGAAASAVRSVTLDADAWLPTTLALFAAVGNDASNTAWAPGESGLGADARMEERLEYARAKYVDRLFVPPAATDEVSSSPHALAAACASGDLARVMRLLAAGAPASGPPGCAASSTPLAAAATACNLLAASALILNGADVQAALEAMPAAAAGGADDDAMRALLTAAAARRAHGRGGAPSGVASAAASPTGEATAAAVVTAAGSAGAGRAEVTRFGGDAHHAQTEAAQAAQPAPPADVGAAAAAPGAGATAPPRAQPRAAPAPASTTQGAAPPPPPAGVDATGSKAPARAAKAAPPPPTVSARPAAPPAAAPPPAAPPPPPPRPAAAASAAGDAEDNWLDDAPTQAPGSGAVPDDDDDDEWTV